MKMTERSVFSVVLFSVITFGIYYYYWVYRTSSDLKLEKQRTIPPGVEVLLGIITLGIYLIYWNYKTAKEVHQYAQTKGYKGISNQSIIFLVLSFLPYGWLIVIGLIQSNINTICFLENRELKKSV